MDHPNSTILTEHLSLQIFAYIHPNLNYFISKSLYQGTFTLPISTIISLGAANSYYLDTYKKLLLEDKFQSNIGFLFSKYGNIHSLKWLIASKNYPWDNRVLNSFACRGDLESFNWARNNGCPWGTNPVNSDEIYLLTRKDKNNFKIDYGESTAVTLVRCGLLSTLQEAVLNGLQITKEAIIEAVKCGFLDICQWVYNAYKGSRYGFAIDVFKAAFDDPALTFMKWICDDHHLFVVVEEKEKKEEEEEEEGDDDDDDDDSHGDIRSVYKKRLSRYAGVWAQFAASKGYFHYCTMALQCVEKRKRLFDYDYLDQAFKGILLSSIVSSGKLELSTYIYMRYKVYFERYMNATLCSLAASTGNYEYLCWLRSINCTWDETTYQEAAANGHINILELAFVSNCPYSVNAQTNMDDTLKWYIRDLGKPRIKVGSGLEEFVAYYAASCGQLNVLEWLLSRNPSVLCRVSLGRVVVASIGSCCVCKFENASTLLEVLQWAVNQDNTIPRIPKIGPVILKQICKYGSINLVEWWFTVVHFRITSEVYMYCLNSAADTGNTIVLEYLRKQYSSFKPWFNRGLLKNACVRGHTNVLQWAYQADPYSNEWDWQRLELLIKLAIGMEQFSVLIWIEKTVELEWFQKLALWEEFKYLKIALEVKNLAILNWVSFKVGDLSEEEYSTCLESARTPVSSYFYDDDTIELTIEVPEINAWLANSYRPRIKRSDSTMRWWVPTRTNDTNTGAHILPTEEDDTMAFAAGPCRKRCLPEQASRMAADETDS